MTQLDLFFFPAHETNHHTTKGRVLFGKPESLIHMFCMFSMLSPLWLGSYCAANQARRTASGVIFIIAI